jgi:hypothetical protein
MSHEELPFNEHDTPAVLIQLDKARGSIGAEHTAEVVAFGQSVVGGEYHDATQKHIVCKCIDGRRATDALEGPNSAGGTLSLLVADDLTSRRYINLDDSIATGFERLTRELYERGEPVGVHTDTHATGENSGCGANDKLPAIYVMITREHDYIRQVAESILGQPIADDVHESIVARASERQAFSSGGDVEASVVGASETLEGQHNEVVAVINLVPGTTLNRQRVADEHGDELQAFNIDAWAFEASARMISEDTEDMISQKIIALTYYNLATALVLCGPNMLVGVRK